MNKHIFVTGGVVSSLGKGLTSACIGLLLERRGLTVRLSRCDCSQLRQRKLGVTMHALLIFTVMACTPQFPLTHGHGELAAAVVFDFSKMKSSDGEHTLEYEVCFDGSHTYRYSPNGAVDDSADLAAMLHGNLKAAGVKCELKGKYTVVVYSWKKNGLDRAVRSGNVTSESIKPEGLPKVNNPPKA